MDIEAGEEAVRLIKADAESTYIPGVLGSLGGFAGMFQLPAGLQDAVLVTSTDGVGTKLLLAQETGRLDTVGIDLVAMSVNDVLTVGARPILFLDYVAVGRLLPAEMAPHRGGVAEGCRQAGCALVGGEMAEMPGLYDPGRVRPGRLLRGPGRAGQAHRRQHGAGGRRRPRPGFQRLPLQRLLAGAQGAGGGQGRPGRPLPGRDRAPSPTRCCAPTRIYVKSILRLLDEGVPVKSMAHITGGGMIGNFSRVIPDGLSAQLHFGEWKVPPLFRAIQPLGDIADAGDVHRVQHGGSGRHSSPT